MKPLRNALGASAFEVVLFSVFSLRHSLHVCFSFDVLRARMRRSSRC